MATYSLRNTPLAQRLGDEVGPGPGQRAADSELEARPADYPGPQT